MKGAPQLMQKSPCAEARQENNVMVILYITWVMVTAAYATKAIDERTPDTCPWAARGPLACVLSSGLDVEQR